MVCEGWLAMSKGCRYLIFTKKRKWFSYIWLQFFLQDFFNQRKIRENFPESRGNQMFRCCCFTDFLLHSSYQKKKCHLYPQDLTWALILALALSVVLNACILMQHSHQKLYYQSARLASVLVTFFQISFQNRERRAQPHTANMEETVMENVLTQQWHNRNWLQAKFHGTSYPFSTAAVPVPNLEPRIPKKLAPARKHKIAGGRVGRYRRKGYPNNNYSHVLSTIIFFPQKFPQFLKPVVL